MYKKLTILFLLCIPAMVMSVGNELSVLGKRPAPETALPSQPPLKQTQSTYLMTGNQQFPLIQSSMEHDEKMRKSSCHMILKTPVKA